MLCVPIPFIVIDISQEYFNSLKFFILLFDMAKNEFIIIIIKSNGLL